MDVVEGAIALRETDEGGVLDRRIVGDTDRGRHGCFARTPRLRWSIYVSLFGPHALAKHHAGLLAISPRCFSQWLPRPSSSSPSPTPSPPLTMTATYRPARPRCVCSSHTIHILSDRLHRQVSRAMVYHPAHYLCHHRHYLVSSLFLLPHALATRLCSPYKAKGHVGPKLSPSPYLSLTQAFLHTRRMHTRLSLDG